MHARHGSAPLGPRLTPHLSSVPSNPTSEPSSYTVHSPPPFFFTHDLFTAQISQPLNYFLTHSSFPLDCEFPGGRKYKCSRSPSSARGWHPAGAYDMVVAWEDNGVRWDELFCPCNSNNLRPYFQYYVWGPKVPEGPIIPTENTKIKMIRWRRKEGSNRSCPFCHSNPAVLVRPVPLFNSQ